MSQLDPRLPLIGDFNLEGKVVLARVDHNVVEKGLIKDSFRIDATFGLIHHISSRGGFPILMTHIGRTRDKAGNITASPDTAVTAIVDYLNRKIAGGFVVPDLPIHGSRGIESLPEETMAPLLARLRGRDIGGIYLPNTRWFAGEESGDERTVALAGQLGALADLYVNDAFGSWQPHASTFDVAKAIPAAAGFLMQKELIHLDLVLNPSKPFLAVVAGSKYDTKIGPLNRLYDQVDALILGGVIYNAFLAAKYGVEVRGVDPGDVELARGLVEKDRGRGKILEPGAVIESGTLDRSDPGTVREVRVSDLRAGQKYGYFLDVAPGAFDDPALAGALSGARTIFVNAVMGLTPHFPDGSARLYSDIARNRAARKLFGGGDTLTELKNLTPGVYLAALDDESYYFFTGGGAVLTAIEGGAYGLKPVAALLRP
ncbi:MAG: phosphoglycerate kinase [Deltaproteobacteria bacterium]|jgi:phosphoglycerate kinase|nr:phosphoglycerate kinase [Deltaproteobacteria bacterium]